jgi:hypothetical protein
MLIEATHIVTDKRRFIRDRQFLVAQTVVDDGAFEAGEAKWEALEVSRRETFAKRHGIELGTANAVNALGNRTILTSDIRTRMSRDT